MAISLLDQETQVRSSFPVASNYVDSVAPTEAAYETNTTNLNDDLNNLRSQVNNIIGRNGAGFPATDWFGDLTAPSTLEAGTQRGVDAINDGLHAVEKKRVLKCLWGLKSISIAGAGDTFDILGTGELPGNTTAAVGAVTTLGTVVADGSGGFGAHSLAEVTGVTAISPKNLVQIVDAATRDPILDGDDKIYGLLQSETAADGHTITDTTTTRVQISFVKLSGAGTDLIAIASGAMDGKSYDYCYVERVRLEDLNEADFLGGANVDVPAGTTVTRQAGYDNQGATPVDLTTNAILDLEGAGLSWQIRDDLEAMLFQVIEGSAGGTSQLNVGADVDEFDVDAAVNDFANGATLNSGGTRPIAVGVTDGVIESTAGDLEVQAFAELLFDDVNQTGSTWAQDGIKLSEDTAEWDAFETAFGEVSLLNALVQAKNTSGRRKVHGVVTANVAADVDVSLSDGNLDTALGDLSQGTFVDDYDIFLNGALQVNGANAAANKDVYPGTDLDNTGDGQLKFEKKLKAGNVICVIDWVA